MHTLASGLQKALKLSTTPTPPPALDWRSTPEKIVDLLRNGGVVMVTGIIASYVPKGLRNNPRFVFKETPQHAGVRHDAASIPSNCRVVLIGRFIRHSYADTIRSECRKRQVPFEYFDKGLGPIWKLLDKTSDLLNPPVTEALEPLEEESPVPSLMHRPAGTWGTEPDPKADTDPGTATPPKDVEAPVVARPRTRYGLKDFIASRATTFDYTKTCPQEAFRIHTAYVAGGGTATLSAVNQALRVWAIEHKKVFAKAYGASGAGQAGSTVTRVTHKPFAKPELPRTVAAPVQTPPVNGSVAPAPAPVSPAPPEQDFDVLLRMIGDAKATIALLEEFVQGIREIERKRRDRDAQLKRLMADI